MVQQNHDSSDGLYHYIRTIRQQRPHQQVVYIYTYACVVKYFGYYRECDQLSTTIAR